MSNLTEDEFTCLMIMREGQNLIRMKDTRWYRALTSLHERGLTKPIGNENYIISEKGLQELIAYESGETAVLRHMITKQGEINAARLKVHEKMQAAVALLADAAQMASATTGESSKDALRKIGHEVLERALQRVV